MTGGCSLNSRKSDRASDFDGIPPEELDVTYWLDDGEDFEDVN
jgi:hypothetical protein